MFASTILVVMVVLCLSNGAIIPSSSLRPNQEKHLHQHNLLQSKRQMPFGNDRWMTLNGDELDEVGMKNSNQHIRIGPMIRFPWQKRTSLAEKKPTAAPQKAHKIPVKNVITEDEKDDRQRENYDVPQIECPQAEDGMDRFACPTPDRMGRFRCVDDHVLCDGFVDCPSGEDEDRQACLFFRTTKAHLDVIADAVLRWARGNR